MALETILDDVVTGCLSLLTLKPELLEYLHVVMIASPLYLARRSLAMARGRAIVAAKPHNESMMPLTPTTQLALTPRSSGTRTSPFRPSRMTRRQMDSLSIFRVK